MEEPLNSPVVHSAQPPDFGSSFIDAFKASGLEDIAVADGVASEIKEEPKAKKQSPPSADSKKSNSQEKLSRAEMDIDQMFKPKEKAVEIDSDIPESIKSTKAADAFRKIKEEKAQLSKQLDDLKAGKVSDTEVESKFKTLQSERDALSERVRLLDIERHPDFVKKYESKITGVFD